jgi:polyferredoxin
MTSTETARELILLAGGPSIIGVSALLTYLVRTLAGDDRIPRKGWLALGSGCLIAVWLGLLLIVAAPLVWKSWNTPGAMDPILVFLSATWVLAAVLLTALMFKGKAVCRYLAESYPPREGPWSVRLLRRWTRV